MRNISYSQIKLLKKIKQYLKNTKKKNIDTSKSCFCYFNTYSETPGNALLNLFNNSLSRKKFYIKVIQSIYSILFISKYKLTNLPKINFDNIVITWGSISDFQKGEFNDKFSKCSSKTQIKTLFFVIYSTEKKPKIIPRNVILFFKENTKLDVIFFIKNLFKVLFVSKFSVTKFFHYFSQQSVFSDEIYNKLISVCDLSQVKKVIIPYEGQPYQNFIFKKVKKINNKIHTIGYIHSMVPALPVNFIKREGSPDTLYLTGIAQKNLFVNFLNWKKKNLKLSVSPRISKKINRSNYNSIFFPIYVNNNDIIEDSFESFIKSKKNKYFNFLNIKKHPSALNDPKQNLLKEKLLKIIKKNRDKFNSNSKTSLNFFIGPTSSFIQYLENNLFCIHFSANPIFDVYSFGLWKKVFPKQINKYMYTYSLIEKKKMIKLNNNKNFLLKKVL